MADDANVLIRVETEIDRGTFERRYRRGARRPPRSSDRWWALGVGLVCVLGWITTGPNLVWYLGLGAAGIFLVGEVLERRTISRGLAAVPPEERHRTFEIGHDGVRVVRGDGQELTRATWREIDGISLREGGYLLSIDDQVHELPVAAFPSEIVRGSFEALAARNDRPVHRD